jgi:hypothetical protein
MKKLFVFIAAVAALSSCSDIESARKHRESLKYKKVRAKMLTCHSGICAVSKITNILTVDTMYHVNDTILESKYMYIIVK